MRSYIATTGIVFALIVLAHAARVMAEGPRLLKEPSFVATSVLAIGLCIWAWLVFRRTR